MGWFQGFNIITSTASPTKQKFNSQHIPAALDRWVAKFKSPTWDRSNSDKIPGNIEDSSPKYSCFWLWI